MPGTRNAGRSPKLLSRLITRVSRIGFRLMLFNLLLIALPIGAVIYLHTYEEQLLAFQERSMVQQGRLLASALSGGVSGTDMEAEARRILINLNQRSESRIRVINADGRLVADSASLGQDSPSRSQEGAAADNTGADELRDEGDSGYAGPGDPKDSTAAAQDSPGAGPEDTALPSVRDSFLYRLGSLPVKILRNILGKPGGASQTAEFYGQGNYLAGAEVREALAGRYGARTRYSPGDQRSVQLYSAIPVFRRGEVAAAVLVSQSTYRILNDIYLVRRNVFIIFLWSAAAAIAISLLLSATISRPMRKLQHSAAGIIDHRGRISRTLNFSRRRDEIGDLSRSFGELTARVKEYSDFLEGFASEVSHELRNPLAGIRAGAELLARDFPENPQLGTILDECRRMDVRIRGIAELSRLDLGALSPGADIIDISAMLRAMAEHLSDDSCRITVSGADGRRWVRGSGDQLERVFENLLINARDFAGLDARGTRVSSGLVNVRFLTPEQGGAGHEVEIQDNGPGIAADMREQVFGRFFSQRSGELSSIHSGLGLSISRSIVRNLGGSLELCADEAELTGTAGSTGSVGANLPFPAGKRTPERLSGACFFLVLPQSPAPG